ncbi:MAG: NAD-dependent protein deacylase [Haloferacaceae archaeon]
MDERIEALAGALREADTAAAFTGAGISAASGVPTFRGADGIWETQFDPADFEYDRFRSDPAGFWSDRLELREALRVGEVEPNPAHEALAELEAAGHLDGVITQNTDGLHQRAGSDRVVELHGSGSRVVCVDCDRRVDAAGVVERVRDGERPPECEACGGLLKPDVTLFGERLDRLALNEARSLAESSDVFLAAGSSLTVQPAAGLPVRAARDGTLAIVNLEATPHDDAAAYVFHEDVTEVLPRVAATVLE